MKKSVMKFICHCKKFAWSFLCFLLYFPVAFADSQSGPIPLSQALINEANNNGVDHTGLYILQSVLLPLLEIAATSVILYAAISSILAGVEEAKIERTWAPLKLKIIIAVLVIVFGGLCVYLMNKERTYTFSS